MEIKMDDTQFIENSEKWDSRELGASPEHAIKATDEVHQELTDALGLQLISIRLQKKLIEDLKFIAKSNGIGYQPLIRDLLNRFVLAEKKSIMRDTLEKGRIDLLKEEKKDDCDEDLISNERIAA